MEMKNREQRRREKFGRAGKVSQHDPHDPWPESEANPALKSVTADLVAESGGAEEDAPPVAGPKTDDTTDGATDGATERTAATSKAKASTPKKRAKS